MKKSFSIITILLIAIVVFQVSCSKDVKGRTDDVPSLNPSNIDIDAGSWKPVLVKPDTFAVAIPSDVTTPAYISELNEIKGLQENLNSDQKNQIKYWSAGNVLRWNEI